MRSKIFIICVILAILGTVLIYYTDINFIIPLFNTLILTLVGIRGRIKPSDKEIYNMKNSRRIKNKTYMRDEDYILICKKYSYFYIIIGFVWGIYLIFTLLKY